MTVLVTLIALFSLGSTVRIGTGSILKEEILAFPTIRRNALKDSPTHDWLVNLSGFTAKIFREGTHSIVLTNGLIERTIRISPDAATVSLKNLSTGQEMIRAVCPEASIQLNGIDYAIGGLLGQTDQAYLTNDVIKSLKINPNAFHLSEIKAVPIEPSFDWSASRFGHLKGEGNLPNWPPKGIGLEMKYIPPATAPGLSKVTVTIHYELYDNLPLYGKWIEVKNSGSSIITVNRFTNEELHVVESESAEGDMAHWHTSKLQLITNYTFGGDDERNAEHAIQYLPDPTYDTQVAYDLSTPCIMQTSPPLGPDADISPGKTFTSFRTYGLLQDTTDQERKSLEYRMVVRTLAPWTVENPIFFHLTDLSGDNAYKAIDQCTNAGFEMMILSFGSGLNMEDDSPANIEKYKKLADYAHSKGILIGGYSLLASRDLGPKIDVIDPKTGKPGAIFGASPCLSSQWGHDYFKHIKTFIKETGFDCLENDGSYPGDVCASTDHKYHKGLLDSQWTQFAEITKFYHWCRKHDIYLNVPDWYFLQGSNKSGMGYRETNWSLPRAQQIIHARQNLFDGTWNKSPSMGWMFVPLVQYHGGGSAATLEPLKDHLKSFKAHLTNNLGYGAQAAYRGWRLYDSSETKDLILHWIDWYKLHREVLESEVIHGVRADGRDIDWIVHVNPDGREKAMALFWNPTKKDEKYVCNVPLYYSGLTDQAHFAIGDGKFQSIKLDRNYKARITISVPAEGFAWAVFTK